LWAFPFASTSAGALVWHLAQSALVSATAGLAAGAGAATAFVAGAAGSAATATEASRSSADAKETILFIFPPLFYDEIRQQWQYFRKICYIKHL
jgi:hypothetical protein